MSVAAAMAIAAGGGAQAQSPSILLPLSPLTGEIKVSTQGNHHRWGDIARQPDGDFVVAWQIPSPDSEVWARRFAADGSPKGEMFQVVNETKYLTNVSVAVDEDGDFVVVWGQGDFAVTSGRPNGDPYEL